jgi:hypothetical protein
MAACLRALSCRVPFSLAGVLTPGALRFWEDNAGRLNRACGGSAPIPEGPNQSIDLSHRQRSPLRFAICLVKRGARSWRPVQVGEGRAPAPTQWAPPRRAAAEQGGEVSGDGRLAHAQAAGDDGLGTVAPPERAQQAGDLRAAQFRVRPPSGVVAAAAAGASPRCGVAGGLGPSLPTYVHLNASTLIVDEPSVRGLRTSPLLGLGLGRAARSAAWAAHRSR